MLTPDVLKSQPTRRW